MKIHISYTYGCPDETILRELMSYDIQCPECTILEPHENAPLNFEVPTSFTSLHWSRQYEYPWAIMHSNLKPSDVCLDAGGAYAVFKYAVAKRCAKVVTIDMNQDYLDKSIRSAKRLGFKNIEFYNSKIQDYKTEEKFDKVYCISVLEHIPSSSERIECINNMISMLKKEGELYLTFDFIIEEGENHFDFYMGKNEAAEILNYFGVSEFNDEKYYSASFPGGCVLATICLKVWDI